MNLKDKTVAFIDNGLFVSFARKVAPAFKKAYYYTPYQGAFVSSRSLVVGTQFDEIERILDPQAREDEIDLWVFLDLYQADWQTRLVDQGARVWGARYGEDLELHRWAFKEHLKKIGLPVQHIEHVFGMDSLRAYLKKSKGTKFIKTSFVRGDFETFRHDEYETIEPRLDDLEHYLGVVKDDYEFIVEDDIPEAIEIGYDGFTVNGSFPNTGMIAYEIKDIGIVGTAKSYDQLSEPVKKVNTALSDTFKADNYRGFLSTEIRYSKDKKPYLIDPCCRLGTPSNELLQEMFDGWAEVLWEGSEGRCVTPKITKRFGVMAVIHSEYAVDNWQALQYPRSIDQWVKLRFHVRRGSKDYVAPQVVGMPDLGGVVGVGDTLEAAIKECEDRAKHIKGFGVEVTLESIDKALEVIKKGEARGIKF